MSSIFWYISGFKTEKEAEASLEDMLDWFRKTYNPDEFTVTLSVSPSVYGFTAQLRADKDV